MCPRPGQQCCLVHDFLVCIHLIQSRRMVSERAMLSWMRQGRTAMTARNELAAGDSLDAITDALLTASRLLVAISARSIARVDETITIPQFRTLVILSTRGPINVRTLAGILHVQRSTTGRMVERLVSAGLIDRRPHPASRREVVVELSPRGQEIVHAVTAHRRKEIARVVRNMPQRERYGLVSSLTAFTTAGGEPPARLEIHGYLV